MTAAPDPRAAAFAAKFERVTGHKAELTDFTTFKVTQVEKLLNRADLLDEEMARRLLLFCPREDPAEVAKVMELHEELIGFLPPDAVPSLDEESEHEALAYDLYAAIRELVSAR